MDLGIGVRGGEGRGKKDGEEEGSGGGGEPWGPVSMSMSMSCHTSVGRITRHDITSVHYHHDKGPSSAIVSFLHHV